MDGAAAPRARTRALAGPARRTTQWNACWCWNHGGSCPFEGRCRFQHDLVKDDRRDAIPAPKCPFVQNDGRWLSPRLCLLYAGGTCQRGDRCRYTHQDTIQDRKGPVLDGRPLHHA